jgi:hypothetical protein
MRRTLRQAVAAVLALLQIWSTSSAWAGGAADVNVELPIGEIEQLIQQLQDAGNQVVGQAGIQIRESIRELSEQMRERIDQIKDAAKEVIQAAVAQLKQLLNNLVAQARSLLKEIKSMITGAIECISKQLAQRIAQLKNSILALLEEVAETIKEAVDHIYVRAGQLIDTGTQRVAVVLNKTLEIVAKIVLAILFFVLAFWLIRSFWKGSLPAAKALRYGIPAVSVILLAGIGFLLFSSTALAKVLGSEVALPKWEEACATADREYKEFLELQDQNASKERLKQAGDRALEDLNWCLYASMSPEIGRGTQQKIDEVAALLYPPPPPPASDPSLPATCGGTGRPSLDPRWFSVADLRKVVVLEGLKVQQKVKPQTLRVLPAEEYFNRLERQTEAQPRVLLKTPPIRMFPIKPKPK